MIVIMTGRGVAQRRVLATSIQVNWPASFKSSVVFSCQQRLQEWIFMGCEFVVVSAVFLLDDVSYSRYPEVGVECCIGDVPWCADDHS
jgi:hypothetical protein